MTCGFGDRIAFSHHLRTRKDEREASDERAPHRYRSCASSEMPARRVRRRHRAAADRQLFTPTRKQHGCSPNYRLMTSPEYTAARYERARQPWSPACSTATFPPKVFFIDSCIANKSMLCFPDKLSGHCYLTSNSAGGTMARRPISKDKFRELVEDVFGLTEAISYRSASLDGHGPIGCCTIIVPGEPDTRIPSDEEHCGDLKDRLGKRGRVIWDPERC